MSNRASRLNNPTDSRLSLDSIPSNLDVQHSSVARQHNGIPEEAFLPSSRSQVRGRYAISTVIADPASAHIVSGFSIATKPYLPSSLSSLGTTFTDAGLPVASTSSGKPVAQRRSRAPPPVVSEVRNVANSEFDHYLSEIGVEYKQWEKERRLGRRGTADLGVTNLRKQTLGLGIDGVTAAVDRALAEQQELNLKGEVKEEDLPPLSDVPHIFFEPSFNLSNPRTFDLVTEKIQLRPSRSLTTEITEITSPRPDGPATSPIPGLGPLTLADLATDQILQEKLSHYTAVVESHLVREVGLRSSAFFAALTNLQSLHQQGEDCLLKIGELQATLSPTESGIGGLASRGIQILRAQARRRGLEKIEKGVRAVEEVWNGVESVKELVENAEWNGALEIAEDVEILYYGSDAESKAENRNLAEDGAGTGLSIQSIEEKEDEEKAPTSSIRPSAQSIRVNFTRIKALNTSPSRLAQFRSLIAKSLENELIGILNHEIETAVQEYHHHVENGDWKMPPISHDASDAFNFRGGDVRLVAGENRVRQRIEERIKPTLRGLVRSDGLESALIAWRELVLKFVREKVRKHLPTSDSQLIEEDSFATTDARGFVASDSLASKSLTLANDLRAMTHVEFLAMARQSYSTIVGCVEIVDIQAKLLISLSAGLRKEERLRKGSRTNPPPSFKDQNSVGSASSLLTVPQMDKPKGRDMALPEPTDAESPIDDAFFASFLADVVHAAADLANLRFSKVVAVRTDVHSALSLEEFVEIFDASWAFVVACEQICRRMIVGLRGVMVGQAKSFLQAYHRKTIIQSGEHVINEKWVTADVSPQSQNVVNLIVQSAVADPPEFLFGTRRSSEDHRQTPTDTESSSRPKMDIEGHEFFVVSAGTACVESLADYIKIILNMPLLTTDAMSKIIEYMKSFNSRTCQVVLGAGAMRSAGLKNITAKHLALASQALSVMIALIPYIRETVRRHLNPKQAVLLTDFDKLKRDFQEHQNEIHSKLIAIMSDRLQVHRKTLQSTNWEGISYAEKEQKPNAYMESLVKEHLTLHRVLSRHLSTATVEYIMTQVVTSLSSVLGKELQNIEFKSEGAKQSVINDVRFLRVKLVELQGIGDDFGEELEAIVSKKEIVPDAAHISDKESATLRNAKSSERATSPPSVGTSLAKTTVDSDESVSTDPKVVHSQGQQEPVTVTSLSSVSSSTSQSPQLESPSTVSIQHTVPTSYVPRKSMAQRLADIARRRGSHEISENASTAVANHLEDKLTTLSLSKESNTIEQAIPEKKVAATPANVDHSVLSLRPTEQIDSISPPNVMPVNSQTVHTETNSTKESKTLLPNDTGSRDLLALLHLGENQLNEKKAKEEIQTRVVDTLTDIPQEAPGSSPNISQTTISTEGHSLNPVELPNTMNDKNRENAIIQGGSSHRPELFSMSVANLTDQSEQAVRNEMDSPQNLIGTEVKQSSHFRAPAEAHGAISEASNMQIKIATPKSPRPKMYTQNGGSELQRSQGSASNVATELETPDLSIQHSDDEAVDSDENSAEREIAFALKSRREPVIQLGEVEEEESSFI